MAAASQVRLIAHGGILSDVGWLASKGFDEAGLCVPNGNLPSPAFIHNAGIKYAVLNPWNDAGDPPGSDGNHYAGYMSAIKNAGWDWVAGEGRGGDNIRVENNYFPYYDNYGGIVSEQQYDMYSSPWFHPKNNKHIDYIEIYDNGKHQVIDSCIASMKAAYAAGSVEVGILTGDWMAGVGVTSKTLIAIIDRARAAGIPCNNVCWWCGQGWDIVASLKGECLEQLNGVSAHYGIRHGISGAGGAPPGPIPHIWFGISAPGKNTQFTMQRVGGTVSFYGQQGYVDSKGNWVPGNFDRANMGFWCRATNGGQWVRQALVAPDQSNGSFKTANALKYVGSFQYVMQGATGNNSNIVTVEWLKADTTTPVTPVTPVTPDNPTEPVTVPPSPQDVSMSPITPGPGALTAGLTVVLRDHKKKAKT